MKNNLTSFVLLLLCVFNVEAHNNNSNKKPVIDAYISILDAQHLTSVRVNIENSDDPDGKITKTEINFGDGFVSSKDDVIHQYAADGVYTITIKAWDNKNAVSVVTKNIDVASNLILSDGASIYGPVAIKDNKTYSFNANASQLEKKFKLVLTQQSEGIYSMYLNKLLNWYYKFIGNKHTDKFEANVELNGIQIFAKNEISKNTLIAEKFVNLKSTNKLKADFEHEHGNKFKVEIKEVVIVKDTEAPVIAINVESGAIVNQDFIPVNITDASGQVTTYVWKVMLQAQNGPPASAGTVNQLILTTNASSFNIPLTQGSNSFILQTLDIFGNLSYYYYINNITFDNTAPEIISMEIPIESGTFFYYKIPQVQEVLPLFKNFTFTASEYLSSVELITSNNITEARVVTANVPRTQFSGVFKINTEGVSSIQLKIKDYVGNERIYTYSINNILVSEPIQVSLQPAPYQTYYTNQHFFNISYQMQANYPVYSKAFVNAQLQATNEGPNASISVPLTQEGSNVIDMQFLYAFESRFAAALGAYTIVKDSVAPSLSSSAPENNTTVYANHLPLTVPLSLQFSENLTNISINGVSSPTFTNSYSTNHFVSSAGSNTLQILATDRAGNVGQLSHQINVQFSDADLNLQLSENSIDILTNKISIPLSGVASEKLQSIKMNNQVISIGADGKSFSGTFEAPADGLHYIIFEGTDIYGNVGTTDTYIRVVTNLPDGIEDYKGPDATFNNDQYDVDAGDIFANGPGGDVCGALDTLFGGVNDIGVQDVVDVFGHIPNSYTRKIPRLDDVESFYNKHIERDPANIVKAGYLMMCHGFDLFAGTDCQQNRNLFKRVMRQYPEPFIIRKLPIPPVVQNFLIKRYNICTGLDTSELGCKDLAVFAPFIADLALPGLGQLIGSDMGQFVMETLLCKELCDQPQYAATPLCQEFELPKIPNIPNFGAPRFSFPGGGPGGSWGRGGSWPGGGGGSCGVWFQPRCPGNGDNNGGAGQIGIDYICSAVPSLWLCHPDSPTNTGTITLTPIEECNPNWTINDIMNLNPPGSASLAFTNYISSCLSTGVPFVPDNKKPILVVTEPLQNQTVNENTIRVKGYVDDETSKVKIEGVEVPTLRGSNGLYFDVEISVPVDLKINVEASDASGNLADPAEILLNSENNNFPVSGVTDVDGYFNICAVNSGSVYCWGINTSGGTGQTEATTTFPKKVLVPGDYVIDISVGALFSCALNNLGDVYCWGRNLNGELGNGTTVNTHIPTKVTVLAGKAKSISSGNLHTCALLEEGQVQCWGDNTLNKTNTASLNGRKAISVTASANISCAVLENKDLHCWGATEALGLPVNSPTDITAQNVSAYSGTSNMCYIKNGGLKCWGNIYSTGDARLTVNNTIPRTVSTGVNYQKLPIEIFAEGSGIQQFSSKYLDISAHSCVLTSSNQIKCWGRMPANEESVADSIDPRIRTVDFPISGQITQILAGYLSTCVIIDKKLYCWGSAPYVSGSEVNEKRLFEFKPLITVTSPVQNQQVSDSVQVTGYVDNVNAIVRINGQQVITIPSAQGAYFDVAINVPEDAQVRVDAVDELGVIADPIIINLNLQYAASTTNETITAKIGNGCVIIDGGVKCWVDNWGLNPDGSPNNSIQSLVSVVGLESGVTAIKSGEYTGFCALKDQEVYCWGNNQNEFLGVPRTTLASSETPVKVNLSESVKEIAMSAGGVCALLSSGNVSCWGAVGYNASYIPLQITSIDGQAKHISGSTSSQHYCAAMSDNQIKCWGLNFLGQLGNQTTIDSPTDAKAVVLSEIINERFSIAVAESRSCYQTKSKVVCWGYSYNNMLGNGVVSGSIMYNQTVLGLTTNISVGSLVAGMNHSCVVDDVGLKCWGDNNSAQLGLGYASQYGAGIVSVVSTQDVVAIATGRQYSCVLKADKKVYCWASIYGSPSARVFE